MQKSKEEGKNNANGLKYLQGQRPHFIKEETGTRTLRNLSRVIWLVSARANHHTGLT